MNVAMESLAPAGVFGSSLARSIPYLVLPTFDLTTRKINLVLSMLHVRFISLKNLKVFL
jgi:hypothetical protein